MLMETLILQVYKRKNGSDKEKMIEKLLHLLQLLMTRNRLSVQGQMLKKLFCP
jgi:hypothetical protein